MSVSQEPNPEKPGDDPKKKEYYAPIRWIVNGSERLGLHHDHAPHWVIALFTFGLLVLAGAAWIESKNTTATLQKQLDVLQQEQQPFVSQADIEKDANKSNLVYSSEINKILWGFRYTNYGKNVAFNVKKRIFLKIGRPYYDLMEGGDWGEPIDMPPYKIVTGTAVSRAGFSETYFDTLMKQDYAIGILVEFVYFDASKKNEFTSSFCMEHLATGAMTFRDPAQCPKQK